MEQLTQLAGIRHNTITIRRAALGDAPNIAALVNIGEREGQLLPRSIESIRASIADWIVALDDDRIVGVGSLLEMNPALSEIRSLAVAPEYRQHGIGAQVVNALTALAAERHIPYVFALTRAVLFFEKLGFIITELFTNCIYHAFVNDGDGEIRISFSSVGDNSYQLMVADNGVGLPDQVDLKHPESIGLDLLRIFVDQLHGSVEINRNNGTQFVITFSGVERRPRR